MLTTLFGFFIAFKLLFVEACNNIIFPGWEYEIDFNESIPSAEEIAQVLAGLLTIGVAFLLYKDEGRVSDNK